MSEDLYPLNECTFVTLNMINKAVKYTVQFLCNTMFGVYRRWGGGGGGGNFTKEFNFLYNSIVPQHDHVISNSVL